MEGNPQPVNDAADHAHGVTGIVPHDQGTIEDGYCNVCGMAAAGATATVENAGDYHG